MLHISLTHTHTHTLSLSLSVQAFHRSWLSIFLLFSRQPNRILDSNFLLFSLRLGIFSISLDFVVLKTYFWSICFCLDLNFVHTPLFAWKILNLCGFHSWIWNAMSKLNLWFCVLRAFNVIAGVLGVQLNEWLGRVQISLYVRLIEG